MNRFEREHVDGIGDGLSMALGILDRAKSVHEAREGIVAELKRAREAKDRDNARMVRELIGASPTSDR